MLGSFLEDKVTAPPAFPSKGATSSEGHRGLCVSSVQSAQPYSCPFLPRMTRHGKNCTAGAVYTYHEKKKDTGTELRAACVRLRVTCSVCVPGSASVHPACPLPPPPGS